MLLVLLAPFAVHLIWILGLHIAHIICPIYTYIIYIYILILHNYFIIQHTIYVILYYIYIYILHPDTFSILSPRVSGNKQIEIASLIFDIALQDVADTVPEPTLPDTIPGDLDSVPQDAQGQPEDQQVSPAGDDGGAKAAPMSDQHPGGDGNVAKAPAEPDKQSLPPNDPAVDGEALDDHELQSLASTMSLGPPWETEFYQYKREGDQWVKSAKEKYASLAIARGWKLGPIPATEDPVVRC